MPLVTHSTGANVPDVNELLPLVDDIPPVHRKADRPRRVPDNLYADRARSVPRGLGRAWGQVCLGTVTDRPRKRGRSAG